MTTPRCYKMLHDSDLGRFGEIAGAVMTDTLAEASNVDTRALRRRFEALSRGSDHPCAASAAKEAIAACEEIERLRAEIANLRQIAGFLSDATMGLRKRQSKRLHPRQNPITRPPHMAGA